MFIYLCILIFSDYDGEFDNLLYFFAFQYLLIKQEKQKRLVWPMRYVLEQI